MNYIIEHKNDDNENWESTNCITMHVMRQQLKEITEITWEMISSLEFLGPR